jgi:hypothetical protein
MSRPILMTDEKVRQLKEICRFKPTLLDCAAFLDVHPSTIEKWIKRNYNISYSEFRDQNMVHTRFMIIREILEQCKKGNMTALIYASKNLCGWADKYEDKISEDSKINVEFSVKE